jgi:DNA (cytosine-5)-methyltransferase 1
MRVVEWFSGIGGARAALPEHADVVLAVDQNERARQTYAAWFGHDARPYNIATIRPERVPDADLWWMSPPCQPYSVRGQQRDLQDRRSAAFLRVLEQFEARPPSALVLENVPWFRGSQAHRRLCGALDARGWSRDEVELCPTELGVPMTRRRFFLVARRVGVARIERPAFERRRLADYVDAEPPAGTELPDVVQERFLDALHVVDVRHTDATAACFTSAYTRSPVYAGSYLRDADGRLRCFSPEEIARLMGFPRRFAFPADVGQQHRYELIGNAVSVDCARVVLDAALR